MADELSLILSALESSDKAAKEENPYSFLSEVGSGTGDLIMKGAASGKWDVGESALGSFVAGLMGGFGDNLGNSYVNKQNQLAQDYLMNGGDRPEGINDSVFKSVSKSRSIFDLANQMEAKKAGRENASALQQTIFKAMLENPDKAQYGLELMGKKPTAEQAAPSTPESTAASPAAPASPSLQLSYGDYLRKFRGDEALARKAFEEDVINKPQKNEDRLIGLRKEFQGLPEVQDFVTADTGIKSLRKAILDPSATSDLELIRGAIQAIEPGMAVREGEQAAVQKSGSFFGGLHAAAMGALTGQTRLTPEQREGIMRIAQRRYNEHAGKFNTAREFYASQAQRMGLPEGITYLESAKLEPYEEQQQTQTMPLPGGLSISSPAPNIKIVNGQTYEKIQGQWQKRK